MNTELEEKLILEAQGHAQEARSMTAVVHEIYQALGIQKGNWNGAKLVVEKFRELQLALLECEKIQTEYVSEEGLCDAIDNDGELYQSQHLALLIESARTAI